MNGKENDWEGVVLIPFIDQELLQTEFRKIDTQLLTEKERKRNQFGETKLYKWDFKTSYPIKSTLPSVFVDIDHCNVSVTDFNMPVFYKEKVLTLHEQTGLHLKSPHLFPTFSLLPHKTKSERIGIKAFSFPSRYPTRILQVERSDWCCHASEEPISLEDEILRDKKHLSNLAQFLRRLVFVKYPYQQLGRIAGFSTHVAELLAHRLDEVNELDDEESKKWVRMCSRIDQKLFKKRGINVGPFPKKDEKIPPQIKFHTMVHIQKLKRMNLGNDGTTIYEWSKKAKAYPLDLVVFDKKKPIDPRYVIKRQPESLENMFKVDSSVIVYNKQHLGLKASILGVIPELKKVRVNILPCSDFSVDQVIKEEKKSELFTSYHLQNLFGFNQKSLAIISSSLYVQVSRKKKVDIGLGLRFQNKQKQREGYCFYDQSDIHLKSGRGTWMYTQAAIDLFSEYQKTHPKIFEFAKSFSIVGESKPHPKNIFPGI